MNNIFGQQPNISNNTKINKYDFNVSRRNWSAVGNDLLVKRICKSFDNGAEKLSRSFCCSCSPSAQLKSALNLSFTCSLITAVWEAGSVWPRPVFRRGKTTSDAEQPYMACPALLIWALTSTLIFLLRTWLFGVIPCFCAEWRYAESNNPHTPPTERGEEAESDIGLECCSFWRLFSALKTSTWRSVDVVGSFCSALYFQRTNV